MKIKIDREKFLQALTEVATFVPNKPVMQILKYARLTTKGNRIKIEATDSESSIIKYMELIENDSDGVFLIDIADFNKLLATLKDETVEINVNETEIGVEHAAGTAWFPATNADEYPAAELPAGDLEEVVLDAGLLQKAISRGKGFVSTDTLRPQMTAIYAYINGGEFGYSASDTHILIYEHDKIESEADLNWFIMPQAFAALMKNCQQSGQVRIQLTENRNRVLYRFGNTIIMTNQLSGKFPDFRRVIPQTWDIELGVDKAVLIDSLRRIKLFSDVSLMLKMDITRLDMTLSAVNLDFMKRGVEHITHNGSSGDIKIGVNVDYVRECANVFPDAEITMRMTDPSRPVIFVQNGNENLQVICMPMRLADE